MMDKKKINIITIAMGAVALIAVIVAVIVHFVLKDEIEPENYDKYLIQARSEYEQGEYLLSISSYFSAIDKVELLESDYVSLVDSFVHVEDYPMALNYAYILMDKTEDIEVLREMYYTVADIYVNEKNYRAAYEMLSEAESRVDGILEQYCEEKTDVTICLAPYADDVDGNFNYVFIGNYPQTGLSGKKIPEYVTKAEFDSDNYAKIYGREYLRVEQDGEYTYYVYEPVRWWVLKDEEEQLTLLADRILDCKQYNESFASITWDISGLRTWMNDDFYNTCFDKEEQKYILDRTTTSPYNYLYVYYAGEDCTDKVALAPAFELVDGTYYFQSSNHEEDKVLRIATGTDYALSQGLLVEENGAGRWWTCTSATKDNTYAIVITEDGNVLAESGGECVNKTDVGVRPLIVIAK